MKREGLIISDIHVGAFDVNLLYHEYSEIFISYINSLKSLDFLIIAGDFFDHKFYLNDKKSVMAYKMMMDLFDVCKDKHTKIRIVYGTDSHECNQYDVLSVIDKYNDVRIIKTCQEEELFEDFHVLYIPEERLYHPKEYYKPYLEKEKYYDYIFGHGVIREVMTNAVVSMENKRASQKKEQLQTPIFSSNKLSYCCKGQTFFGHYHIRSINMDDQVYYCGSFSRWQFGEEEPKGFWHVTQKNDTYSSKFIENTLAQTYITIGYGYENKVFKDLDVMDQTLNKVDKMIKDNVFDHVRFEFNIPATIENPESTVNYLKDRYKFDDKVKVEIIHGYVEQRKEEKKKEIEKENEEFAFISDKSISIEDTVHQFIIIKNNKDVKVQHVITYLSQPIQDIIEKIGEDEDA